MTKDAGYSSGGRVGRMSKVTKIPTKKAAPNKTASNAQLFKIENDKYTQSLNPKAAAKMKPEQLQAKIRELENHTAKVGLEGKAKADLFALRTYKLTAYDLNPTVKQTMSKAERTTVYNKAIKARADKISYLESAKKRRGSLDHDDTFALATLKATKIEKKDFYLDAAGIKKADAKAARDASIRRADAAKFDELDRAYQARRNKRS